MRHAYLFAGPARHGQDVAREDPREVAELPSSDAPTTHAVPPLRLLRLDPRRDVAGRHRARRGVATAASTTSARSAIASPCSPCEGRHKVYILDEAHSLTTDASNALLKTLEEPPEHVVFVLCTTEPHRLLDTIKGRCQAFAFTRPGLDELDTVLRCIAEGEGIEIDDAALDLVARAGRGSFRDAISVLDQLATACDRRMALADARAILGVVDAATLTRIADLVSARDAAGLLVLVDELVEGGQDLGQLLGDLTEHVRLVFLTRQLGEPPRHRADRPPTPAPTWRGRRTRSTSAR